MHALDIDPDMGIAAETMPVGLPRDVCTSSGSYSRDEMVYL
jgi:hypothetical protein